jgi:hypothetical protein
VLLVPYTVRLGHEPPELTIQFVGRIDPEVMHVVARRDRFHPGEFRVLDAPSQHQVADQPAFSKRHLGEGHAGLESDPRFFGKDFYWTKFAE